jgi:hypothetical protein
MGRSKIARLEVKGRSKNARGVKGVKGVKGIKSLKAFMAARTSPKKLTSHTEEAPKYCPLMDHLIQRNLQQKETLEKAEKAEKAGLVETTGKVEVKLNQQYLDQQNMNQQYLNKKYLNLNHQQKQKLNQHLDLNNQDLNLDK